MSDEISEERAPAQVVAQAAPTASDEADTLTDSPSTSPEEEHVENNHSPTSRSNQDHVGKMSTTPPVTPPHTPSMDEEPQSPSSSVSSDWWTELGVPPPPPKPHTVMSPDRAVSFKDISESLAKRNMQRNIFSKTRESMSYQGHGILVLSSRGFQREHLPTKQTRPPLLKRRYSIEVNTTTEWEQQTDRWEAAICQVKHYQKPYFSGHFTHVAQTYDIPELPSKEVDPLPALANWVQLPHPARYTAFAPAFFNHLEPPHNEGVFLTLGDVTLHNDAFNYIGATNARIYGQEVWMRDESLDMALEVLRHDYDCDAHKIGIANSTVAQICYFAQVSGYSAEFEQYRSRYADKNWVFIVINDGIGGVENNGYGGLHWSLAVLDRVSKKCYYFDSLFVKLKYYQDLGRDMSMGMLHILDENPEDWRYLEQFNSPDQNENNRFKDDGGACGPFVYKMSHLLILAIKRCQLEGREDHCDLKLPSDFAESFGEDFHSQEVRYEIQRRIARWAHKELSSRYADEWDRAQIQGTDAVLDDGPVVAFEVPRRSSRSIHSGRNATSGNSYHSPITLEDDDANYAVHGNRRDSLDSNVASAGGDTSVVDLGEDSDSTWVVSDDDMNLDEDDEETAEVVLDGQI
ncbi:hypothetical protein J4E86_002455 [Alternaria arbusti]|uniref:uncharacterized protein n=1 Tax=Alternaria arbusti TaxID=232088 RepID=UPI00221EFA85|nr:uncharacterized protein J4E86_002455 [Alternaria arbusti]KAI4960830.1 hypothetical protein J4E86_002455 [Alternaria arbusti]